MNKTILVADDDPAILDVMSVILEDAGYKVETSSSGEISLDGALPDLFLLDLWMSGRDGRKVCSQIKSHELAKNIPVIIVSANRDIEGGAGSDQYQYNSTERLADQE